MSSVTRTGDGKVIADGLVLSCRPFEDLCQPCDYKNHCPYYHNRWDQQDRYGIKQDVSYVRNLLEMHEKKSIRFLQNSSTSRDIHDAIVSMIKQSTAGEEICITGYFDSLLVKDLLDAIDRKAKVRIISGVLKDSTQDRANKTALNEVKGKGGEIRINEWVHSRTFIMDKEAIVGSADMNGASLTGRHFEAAIWTNNPYVVKSTKDYFNSVFQKSSTFQ
jgi:HKD family nuclease